MTMPSRWISTASLLAFVMLSFESSYFGVVTDVTIVFKGPNSIVATAANTAISATIHVWERTIFLAAISFTVLLLTKMLIRTARIRTIPIAISWGRTDFKTLITSLILMPSMFFLSLASVHPRRWAGTWSFLYTAGLAYPAVHLRQPRKPALYFYSTRKSEGRERISP